MKRFAKKSKRGQTLVEYSLILSFISVVAVSVLFALGVNVKGIFTTVSSQLSAANTAGAAPGGSGGSGTPPTRPGG